MVQNDPTEKDNTTLEKNHSRSILGVLSIFGLFRAISEGSKIVSTLLNGLKWRAMVQNDLMAKDNTNIKRKKRKRILLG